MVHIARGRVTWWPEHDNDHPYSRLVRKCLKTGKARRSEERHLSAAANRGTRELESCLLWLTLVTVTNLMF